ncbi:hypothetical protein [Peribacillus kribbensis]|uniref:hypothetical protein n=1 Tax=Peribacillus kribbensis TaxID=356658 RepID=UPI00040CD1B9|nr:hypothetical protein [Peribacillus kribbensis]
MAERNQNQDYSCENTSLENIDATPGMDAKATCENQAEAARHQAGSSGSGTEFASTDNVTTRKLEP